ncbi:hemerythrin domain-containing protein [Georgenia sp. 10Sc9-8]|uniref:Hemerythrin domain-containing protein n=1 Tax=Georgenia halotolerans TaxID=3028317 RepID=A0ABT5TVS0_9MICO|nr:hemerythrin domain-containing protein [Georgenia halotolerans]
MVTSIAQQSRAELGGPVSVLSRQKQDHVRLDGLLEELATSTGAAEERVLARIYRLVFPHAFAEESVLWPAIRRVLPNGHEITLEVEREHQEVNELVTQLEEMSIEDARRPAVLDRLVEVLREDVRDEEEELLPRLQAAVDRSQLRRLGVYWELVRRVAPTRAHPVVARRPPGNVIAALPLTVIDRLRDLVEYAERAAPARMLDALRATDRQLVRAARRTERLPIMRMGEDPSTGVNT